MAQRNETGAWGEAQAAVWLCRQGFRITARNYRVRGGEIDIIAENREYLVFCEVKTRKDDSYGEAREFVNRRKQEKLRCAALLWLSEHETEKQPRFDVIEIYAPLGANTLKPEIRQIENAF